MSCPRGYEKWQEGAYSLQSSSFNQLHLRVEHRHIQLAFKYTRLQQPQYQAYLQRLLAPYHEKGLTRKSPSVRSLLTAQYSVFSYLIPNADNNLTYLRFSTWSYYDDKNVISLSPSTMGDTKICPHLIYFPNNSFSQHLPLPYIGKKIATAFSNKFSEIQGACPRCPTDFSVEVTAQCVKLRVWQSMGTEGSPSDLAWRIHVMTLGDFHYGSNYGFISPVVYHKPGSIRRLYDERGHN
ncbi:hypothetical protein F4677DRAFT_417963 [Hypoxylon crocopeplum]|nr:hypothetical protein F4677DRAFT_417963 [Hypoxylon crocopeplum]